MYTKEASELMFFLRKKPLYLSFIAIQSILRQVCPIRNYLCYEIQKGLI